MMSSNNIKGIQISKKLINLCQYLNKNDDMEIIENSFFHLWCYHEYVKDTYETNKLKHFENIKYARLYINNNRRY